MEQSRKEISGYINSSEEDSKAHTKCIPEKGYFTYAGLGGLFPMRQGSITTIVKILVTPLLKQYTILITHIQKNGFQLVYMQTRASRMNRGMETLLCKRALKELGLFSLPKKAKQKKVKETNRLK